MNNKLDWCKKMKEKRRKKDWHEMSLTYKKDYGVEKRGGEKELSLSESVIKISTKVKAVILIIHLVQNN